MAMKNLYRCSILPAILVSSMTLMSPAYAKPAFFADFGYAEDSNRDGWPDQWRRHTDRDHPRFVKMGIASRSEFPPEELLQLRRSLAQFWLAWEQKKLPGDIIPESIPRPIDAFLEATIADTCFEIVMNGGAARVEGPSFPIDSRNAYRIHLQMMAEIIDPYSTHASVLWLDSQGTQLSEQLMTPISKSTDWQFVRIPETSGIPGEAHFAKIRITVEPLTPQSIQTIVRCDRVRFDRIPRIELTMTPETRIVSIGEPVELVCKLNEIEPTTTKVELVARDHNGEEIWKQTRPLDASTVQSSEISTVSWKFSLPHSGFYTLVASVIDKETQHSQKQTTLIVLPREKTVMRSPNSRIGWSLPGIGKSISLSQVSSLVEYAHVGGVKFSVWLVDDKTPGNRSLSWMVENLSTKGIQCVGVIDPPNAELQSQFPDKHGKSLAHLLDYPNIWQPMFEPIWRRTSLFLTQFQIGWDQDTSLERHSQWQANVTTLAKHLRTVGAEAHLTLPWNAISESPQKIAKNKAIVWNRVLNYAVPTLTESEIAAFSRQPFSDPKVQWLSLDPIDRNRFTLEDRVRDLTQRMIAVHQNEWDTTWISDPTDPNLAVLDKMGGPDELLMPLERLAKILNLSNDFFTLRLNEHLTGTLFRAGGEERMIVIADSPMKTRLYAGNEWTASDIWGRDVAIESVVENNVTTRLLSIEKWPVILTNVDRSLAQWQVEVDIENSTIENRVGLSEPLRIRLANPESESVSGTIEVIAASLLQDGKASVNFDAKAKAKSTFEVPMKLRYDASQLEEPLNIIVTLNEKSSRQFVVQRRIQVGLKDFQLETQVKIDERGSIIVDLEMLNLSNQTANFDCTLIIPNRTREKFQIIRLEDRYNRPIVVPNGADLRGQSLLLRCEEIGSGRVLNHRIEIK